MMTNIALTFKLDLEAKCVLGFEFPRDDKNSDLGLTEVNSFSLFQKKNGIFQKSYTEVNSLKCFFF